MSSLVFGDLAEQVDESKIARPSSLPPLGGSLFALPTDWRRLPRCWWTSLEWAVLPWHLGAHSCVSRYLIRSPGRGGGAPGT